MHIWVAVIQISICYAHLDWRHQPQNNNTNDDWSTWVIQEALPHIQMCAFSKIDYNDPDTDEQATNQKKALPQGKLVIYITTSLLGDEQHAFIKALDNTVSKAGIIRVLKKLAHLSFASRNALAKGLYLILRAVILNPPHPKKGMLKGYFEVDKVSTQHIQSHANGFTFCSWQSGLQQ